LQIALGCRIGIFAPERIRIDQIHCGVGIGEIGCGSAHVSLPRWMAGVVRIGCMT
jgi:hypothetical protein